MVEMQLRDTDLMSPLRTIMLAVQTYRQLRFSTTRVVVRLIDCHMATIQQNDVLCRGLSLCMGILDKHRRAAEDEAASRSAAQDFFTLVLKLTPPLLQRTCDASPLACCTAGPRDEHKYPYSGCHDPGAQGQGS